MPVQPGGGGFQPPKNPVRNFGEKRLVPGGGCLAKPRYGLDAVIAGLSGPPVVGVQSIEDGGGKSLGEGMLWMRQFRLCTISMSKAP